MMKTISDPYIMRSKALSRILREYDKHGQLIVAFDFDDTVYDTHTNGWKYDKVIDLIKRLRPYAYLICWTASLPERYPMIRGYLMSEGVEFDAINENAPWIESRGPKIYANIYLDDRAGLADAYNTLIAFLSIVEQDEVCDWRKEYGCDTE